MNHDSQLGRRGVMAIGVLLAGLASATPLAGQAARVNQVTVSAPDDAIRLELSIRPGKNDDFVVMLISVSRDGCRYPPSLEIPIQLNGGAFQLRRFIRASNEMLSNSTCLEGLGTLYPADALSTLASAASVTLHLPTGAVTLPQGALEYLRAVAPTTVAVQAPRDAARYLTAIDYLNALLVRGQIDEALQLAEAIAPQYASRPAAEGLSFFAAFGMARRMANDLEGGALCYRIALMIAGASGLSTAEVGSLADNLATVRRLQGRWNEAEAASEQALKILSDAGPSARGDLGAALNNRALLHLDQAQFDTALDYSERALTILREVLEGRDADLAPFLEDNRIIRARQPVR